MADQELPFVLTAAPFPEGWEGDLDEYGQQLYQNTQASILGNFLTGLILPPGSTLPNTDQGPIAMGETWYFWDTATGQYLPQTVNQRTIKNFCRNSSYQVSQNGASFAAAAGITQTFDLCLMRQTTAVLAVTTAGGPVASADNDQVPDAINFNNGGILVATPGASDLYAHEHLIEGVDIVMLQGQVTSLSFNAKATNPGTYSVYLTNHGRDSTYVANFTIPSGQINQWIRIKIAGIPAFPTTGTWNYSEGVTGLYIGVVMELGSQWQTTAPNAWNSGFFAGTSQNLNMLATSNSQLTLTAFKFEAAGTPTYYQCPSFAEEYENVLRYFFTTFSYQSLTAGIPIMAIASGPNVVYFIYTFPRRMCRNPTVTPWGMEGTPAAGNITNLSGAVNIAQATLGALPKGVYAVTTPSAAAGNLFAAYIQADARLS